MHVMVSSRHAEVSPVLRDETVRKISRLGRYLSALDRAEVHFSEEQNPRIAEREVCEVTMEGHGHHLRCKAVAADGFAAVDVAVQKLEHQIQRLKRRG